MSKKVIVVTLILHHLHHFSSHKIELWTYLRKLTTPLKLPQYTENEKNQIQMKKF